jgi:hypothetical protein
MGSNVIVSVCDDYSVRDVYPPARSPQGHLPRIVNTSDGTLSAYTIWVYDVESGKE